MRCFLCAFTAVTTIRVPRVTELREWISVCAHVYIHVYMYVHIYVCMGIYWNDLQAAVQQWLVVNTKFKNPRVVQSHEVGCLSWPSVDAGIPKRYAPRPGKEWMCGQRQGKQAKSEPFLLPLSLNLSQRHIFIQCKERSRNRSALCVCVCVISPQPMLSHDSSGDSSPVLTTSGLAHPHLCQQC